MFFMTNVLLVKYFSKTGHRKTGGRVEGWNEWVLKWVLGGGSKGVDASFRWHDEVVRSGLEIVGDEAV